MSTGPERARATGDAAVVLEDVRFRWPRAEQDCLAVARFELAAGERVFLRGPSGSGKSSLLSLIGGVVLPQAGSVRLAGQALAELSAAARDRHRADHVGVVYQLFNLLPYLSARDNIVLACRFSPARVARLADAGTTPGEEAARLAARLDLDEATLARQASTLSVGQQQRVALARALIGRPGLILADEPTSALDADRQLAFIDLLVGECEAAGAALLFVSHDGRLARHFDRVLDLGEISAAAGAGGRR